MRITKRVLQAASFLTAFAMTAGMTLTVNQGSLSDFSLTAYADDTYTYASNDQFHYAKYSDHIVISSAKSSDIETLVIPDTIEGLPVTEIGIYAFQFTKLKSVTFPDTLTEIGMYTFSYCDNLTEVTIPESVKKIGLRAFEECPALKTVNFPDHLVQTAEYTFNNTPWLDAQRAKNPLVIVNGALIDGRTCEGDVVVPSSVKYVAAGAFQKNDKLTSVVLPAGVTAIEPNTFWYCENLKSAELKGCETMDFGVFAACNKLTDLKLSGKLKKIDDYTFTDNTATATITFYGSQSTWNAVQKLDNDGFLQRANMVFDENHTEEPDEDVIGDINKDGQCDIADAILLQKFLLAKTGIELADWNAGDMDKNGRLNAVDFSLLKRRLLAK